MRPINYDDQGRAMAYHALVNTDGSTTEHTAMVPLGQIVNAKKIDGTDDPNALILVCPTCGAMAWVPLLGGEESQRFHAKVRAARNQDAPYLPVAVQSVIDDVKKRGGVPRLNPDIG